MSLIGHLLGLERRAEKTTMTQAEYANWFGSGFAGSATGRSVTPIDALTQVTVFACIRLIAESVAMLPLILYRRVPDGKQRADDHPLSGILRQLPNPEMTAIELFENLVGHLCLWGNAYCEIEYDAAGRRRALWPLRPDRVHVLPDENYRRNYLVSLRDGRQIKLEPWRIWHVRGWGATDSWTGASPIALMREVIGLGLAAEEYGARFFANDSRPGGILRHPGRLSPESSLRMKRSWESAMAGLSNAHRVAVLEEGVEWQSVGIAPVDAQFLESRKFQKSEICSIYRVPPHMISDVERSTSWGTGIEQQSIAFVTYTLMPYLIRFTQSIARDLLSTSERTNYYAEFLTSALVRGDLSARYQAYSTGRTGGWLSVNDIRALENLDPVVGGDEYLRPLNMTPVGRDENE